MTQPQQRTTSGLIFRTRNQPNYLWAAWVLKPPNLPEVEHFVQKLVFRSNTIDIWICRLNKTNVSATKLYSLVESQGNIPSIG